MRRGIVEDAALYDALVSGKLIAAGLDVFAMEPVDPGSPLLRLDQVVATRTLRAVSSISWRIPHGTPSPTCNPYCAVHPLPPDDVPDDVIVPPPEENK